MTLKAGLWKLRLPRSPWACGTAGPGMGRLRLAGLGGCPGYPRTARPSPLGPETRPSRPARPPLQPPGRAAPTRALSPRRDPWLARDPAHSPPILSLHRLRPPAATTAPYSPRASSDALPCRARPLHNSRASASASTQGRAKASLGRGVLWEL